MLDYLIHAHIKCCKFRERNTTTKLCPQLISLPSAWSPHCTHKHTSHFLIPDAIQLQWFPLTTSEAVLITICLSRCVMTASAVWSGRCYLWCKTEGGGEVWRDPRGVKEQRERLCQTTDAERQRWSLCENFQSSIWKKTVKGNNVEQHKAVYHASDIFCKHKVVFCLSA